MNRIIKNSIQCKHCGDIIESKTRRDYVRCKCGRCSVDGGKDYLERGFSGSPNDYVELSQLT